MGNKMSTTNYLQVKYNIQLYMTRRYSRNLVYSKMLHLKYKPGPRYIGNVFKEQNKDNNYLIKNTII